MATTNYGVNHPLAVKVWAKKLFVEALKATYFDRFMGSSPSSLCQVKDDLSKSAGDRIRIGLRMQMTGEGVVGDDTLEGNEEALQTYSDDLIINQLRHSTRSAGEMSEQRVPFSVREEGRMGLQDWWSDRLDTIFFNHLCGNSKEARAAFTGGNTINAPDSEHRIWPSHMATGEESISTTDIMSLTMIDKAVEKAKTLTPMIRPITMGGDKFYVAFLHPYNVYDLRTSTSTGQWLDIQKAALSSGQRFADNPIWTGALGVYNNVILHESTRVTTGVNSSGAEVSTCRRVVFAGAQALAFGYGRTSQGGEMKWVEELFDYENQLGIAASMIFGTKATRFNSKDFGKIVISTYGVAH